MFLRMILAGVLLTASMAMTAAAAQTGCKKVKFEGSYLSQSQAVDVFGDGSAIHSFAFQLTLHSDGTANQYWTGLPDFMLTAGTGSPQIGSWTCRSDGKLIVNLIQGTYTPVTPGSNPNVVGQDIELTRTFRTTYLFSVDDENTLTKIQSRTRRYLPSEDPTDAAAGTLGAFNNVAATYKRLAATDADLLAP